MFPPLASPGHTTGTMTHFHQLTTDIAHHRSPISNQLYREHRENVRLTQGLTVRVGTFSPQQLTTPLAAASTSRTSNTETHHHSSSEIKEKDKKHSNTICVSIIITIKEKK